MIYHSYVIDMDNFHVNKNEIKLLVDSAMNNAIYHKKLSLLRRSNNSWYFLHWEKKKRQEERNEIMPFFYLSTLRSFCLSASFHLWILTADDYGKEFAVNLFIIRWDNLGNLNNEIQMNCFLNQSNYFFFGGCNYCRSSTHWVLKIYQYSS